MCVFAACSRVLNSVYKPSTVKNRGGGVDLILT
jgi:hypothetical protein